MKDTRRSSASPEKYFLEGPHSRGNELMFSIRIFREFSYAFIIMPGGLGTTDELFEALTLIQTGKIGQFPIIIMGKEYWRDVAELMRKMVDAGTASAKDLELLYFTDSVDEVMDVIRTRVIKAFGFRRVQKRPWRILGERRFESHAASH